MYLDQKTREVSKEVSKAKDTIQVRLGIRPKGFSHNKNNKVADLSQKWERSFGTDSHFSSVILEYCSPGCCPHLVEEPGGNGTLCEKAQ